MVKQVISFDKDEFKSILADYLKSKGFKNISAIKVTIGNCSHDFISGSGYCGVNLEVETTKEESI